MPDLCSLTTAFLRSKVRAPRSDRRDFHPACAGHEPLDAALPSISKVRNRVKDRVTDSTTSSPYGYGLSNLLTLL